MRSTRSDRSVPAETTCPTSTAVQLGQHKSPSLCNNDSCELSRDPQKHKESLRLLCFWMIPSPAKVAFGKSINQAFNETVADKNTL
jgi:hypothetical protein